jgi:cob(I)alamin adenosyltransferase
MRLTKITTRTGDKGTTGLADGTRVAKDHARIAALGGVDELNSQLGVLLAEQLPQDIRAVLLQIQNDLFDLGGALALPTQDAFQKARSHGWTNRSRITTPACRRCTNSSCRAAHALVLCVM